jgi:GNAT superfamily N-acetyltransferase
MADDEAAVTMRAPRPGDEAHWRVMWADFLTGDDEPCPPESTDRLWRDVLADDGPLRMLIAADAADAPIGFMIYATHAYARTPRPVCYLIELYVDPRRRGAGIGSAFLERLRQIGREAGWLKIHWMTQADNFAAHRLYDKFGKRSPLVRYDMHVNDYVAGDGGG